MKQKRKGKFFETYIKPGILAAIILFLAFATFRQLQKGYASYVETRRLAAQLQELEEANSQIRDQIESYEDPGNIDLEARNRLNLKKEGEHVVVIIPPQQNPEETQLEEIEGNTPELSLWDKIKEFFGSD